ncbi:MAG TPA: ribonuclease E/G, partial [Lacibacter sp.]|nr:ribonuclease E/G [Lacibacter sp.]
MRKKASIAAAPDLPRQLRLRGLGGQITVDFAPVPKKDRGTLEQVLRAAFKGEAAETILAELGVAQDVPRIEVWNKADLLAEADPALAQAARRPEVRRVSALTG